MLKLRCQCCDIEQLFENDEAAFEAGWDAPPQFSTHICCDLCPVVCVILNVPHNMAHALWKREGRPDKFSVAKCGTNQDIEKITC